MPGDVTEHLAFAQAFSCAWRRHGAPCDVMENLIKKRRPPGDVTEHLASRASPSWWSSGTCDCGLETASAFPPASFGAEDLERHVLDLLGCHSTGFRSGCLAQGCFLKARSAVLHLEGREGLAAHLVTSQSTWRRRRAPGGLAWRALLAGGGQHLANA